MTTAKTAGPKTAGPKTAAYLYCIVEAATRPSTARVPDGVPGAARPAAHRLAPSLWIVTADVPLDLYGPAHLEPRLRDLDWVAQVALAHEGVVERFSKAAPVVPMKLFTLFSSLEKALADVSTRKAQLQRAMRHIAGAEEWGIRVFRRPVEGPQPPRTGRPASGADFLRVRKQARDAVASARAAASAAVEIAFDQLRRRARDARVREARRETGTNPPMLDAAFLVPVTSRARFKREVKRQSAALAKAGADLVLSGPWPAYNFVDPEDRA